MMSYVVAIAFGGIIWISVSSYIVERNNNINKNNQELMMKEIKKDMKSGYRPDLKAYRKKYNLDK